LGIDAGVVGSGANFNTFLSKGAYAAGMVNNSLKFLTAQAWYYDIENVANAYWLQADWTCQLVKDIKVGVQYADMDPKGIVNNAGVTKDSSAYAAKLAYVGIDKLNLSAAYSKVSDKGSLKIANVATDNLSSGQSKLYTEAWWNYGYVGAPDASSVNLTAEYDAGIAKLGAYYTHVSVSDTKAEYATKADHTNLNEVTVTATKSYGPLDTTVAYVSTNANDQNSAKQYNSVQAYLTLNF
jgi:hypothetical protein